jgi:hypothetical protein
MKLKMPRTVFWSWQSDLPASVTKNFVKKALTQALKKISSDLELESADRIELDHDTKGEAGLVEIASTIFGKIDVCEVFVGDVTPIGSISTASGEKKVPNPNVMIELGYALRELGYKRVITVANLAYGGRPEELPFDLRHRRGPITYTLESAADPRSEKVLNALTDDLALALKSNLAATREDKLIKNPMPSLSLETAVGMPAVTLVTQCAELEGVPTLEEIKQRTPCKTKADQKSHSPNGFSLLANSGPYLPGKPRPPKPFQEWTQEELEDYNKRVESYYQRYEEYLEALRSHQLRLQRAVGIKLRVKNTGTLPATDVRMRLTFPPNVSVYEDNDLPPPPNCPTPPQLALRGEGNLASMIRNPENYGLVSRMPTRISDDRSSLYFDVEKLQHNYTINVPSFTALLETEENIKSFEIDYFITADELPQAVKKKLPIEVARS